MTAAPTLPLGVAMVAAPALAAMEASLDIAKNAEQHVHDNQRRSGVRPGGHKISATYSGGGKYEFHSSGSSNLLHAVASQKDGNCECR